ncbi:4Fe-4S binding protein, partial [bacterium]|nr:4Fe-4S binding protein [bacterium]
MKQLVVLSGKGGTGKTSLSAALANLAAKELNLVLVDADADAANLALLLDAPKGEHHDFIGGKIAVIDPLVCKGCGQCIEVCRFDALEPGVPTKVNRIACEGCGSCSAICPIDAISMELTVSGHWIVSPCSVGNLFHARLYAGMENTGKFVSELRRQARQHAQDS